MIGTVLLEFNCGQLLSVGPQHSKWRLCIIIVPWNYDAVEILTNLNVAQSVKKWIISLTLFPFPSTLDNFQMVKQCMSTFIFYLLHSIDKHQLFKIN